MCLKNGIISQIIPRRIPAYEKVTFLYDEKYSADSPDASASAKDILSAETIRLFLPEKFRGIPVIFHDEIDSTNTEAKRLISSGELRSDCLIAAASQTEGRGRMGRSFYSPSGTGIYMSLVLHPKAELSDSVSVTTMASVAVIRAIRSLTGLEAGIKWVNDIYMNGRKVCGILSEAVFGPEKDAAPFLIVGIGINVSTDVFPEELRGIAASIGVQGLSRAELAACSAAELLSLSADLSDRSYMDEYRACSLVLGHEITYTCGDTVRRAEAVGVDDSGGLMVLFPDGSSDTLRSGEISVRLTD